MTTLSWKSYYRLMARAAEEAGDKAQAKAYRAAARIAR